MDSAAYYLSGEGLHDGDGELVFDYEDMRKALRWQEEWREFKDGRITVVPNDPFTQVAS